MARWVVFRELVVGHLEAADRPAAEAIARRRFGDTCRVQSDVSYRIGLDERAEIERNRTRDAEDDG